MDNKSNTSPEAIQRIQKAAETKEKELDLSGLGLTEIPMELTQFPELSKHLTSLQLYSNQISRIENLEKLTALTILELQWNQISRIENLEKLTALTSMSLQSNQISRIENLEKLKALNWLSLSANQITRIENLEKLKALTKLYMHTNQISRIENLEKLTALTKLYLHSNQINRIENLEKLTALTKLELQENQINRIENLDKLTALTILNLSSNQIGRIENLEKLTALIRLDLPYNKIQIDVNEPPESFYNWITKMGPLLVLRIEKNPYLQEIDGIVEADYSLKHNANHRTNFIADYKNIILSIKNLIDIKWTHKLVLLGNSNSGKSSLVKFLIDGLLVGQSEVKSTDTLEIIPWKADELPEFMIYDFGGQDYYHGTYQLFFSDEASYILLWSQDNNTNDSFNPDGKSRKRNYYSYDLNYWLGNIKYLNNTIHPQNKSSFEKTEDSNKLKKEDKYNWFKNLLLVENKIDAIFKDAHAFNANPSFGEFERFRISLKEGSKNQDEEQKLINEVTHSADLDPHIWEMRRDWLKKYLIALHPMTRKENADRAKALDTFQSIWGELCQKKNRWPLSELLKLLSKRFKKAWAKLEHNEKNIILRRLCQSGLMIWHYNDPILKDEVWIHPKMLQEEVVEMLNDDSFVNQNGIIPQEELDKLARFKELKNLLLKQQVVFLDKSYKKGFPPVYIIPRELPMAFSNEPLFNIALAGLKPSFTVRFRHFMPWGIMNRLICMVGRLPHEKSYSRYQVIFTQNDVQVFMKCDFKKLSIELHLSRVSKKATANLFQKILLAYHREDFEYFKRMEGRENKSNLNERIEKKEGVVEEEWIGSMIPWVPDDLEIALNDEIFINYHDLVKAKELQQRFIFGNDKNGHRLYFPAYRYNAFMDHGFDNRKRVFISYSHEDDAKYLKNLKVALRTLENDQLIQLWDDGKIKPGEKWNDAIIKELNLSEIVIVLVSQSTISSNYINTVELQAALKKYNSGRTQIIPILIRNCDYEHWSIVPEELKDDLQAGDAHLITNFQFLPIHKTKGLLPINQWPFPENAWKQIAHKIRKIVSK